MISIITPVFNEEKIVKPFLSHIEALEGDFELIMVDGDSTDGTQREIERCSRTFSHRILLLKSDRGRATQMNKGAGKAEGDILLFLHVDCSLKKDSLTFIEKAICEKKAIGGGFRQAFSSPSFFLKFQSTFGNLRAGLTGIFFGDYGIFIRKEVFKKMGGYESIPFMEDAELCRKAKKYGRLVQIDRFITTSPRRYFEKGKLTLMAAFLLANFLNVAGWRPGFLIKYIVNK